MKSKNQNNLPVLIGGLVILVVLGLQAWDHFLPAKSPFTSLRNMAYDWRMRLAMNYSKPHATNLAAVFIDEETLQLLSDSRNFGYKAHPPIFPRHVYGRLVRELAAQGASVVGLDVLYKERREDWPVTNIMTELAARSAGYFDPDAPLLSFKEVKLKRADGIVPGVVLTLDSDEYFALQMRRANNVVIGAQYTDSIIPDDLFRTNCYSVADISSDKDSDGKFRRLAPFRDYIVWNAELKSYLENEGFKLAGDGIVTTNAGKILFHKVDPVADFELPLDGAGNFKPSALNLDDSLPPQKPFELRRYWHMGIVTAAKILGLDLSRSVVERSRIILKGPGMERILPLDKHGNMLIDWSLTWEDTNLVHQSCGAVLSMDHLRLNAGDAQLDQYLEGLKSAGKRWNGKYPFEGKVVFVGSKVVGSNMSDMGATPISAQTFFVSTHWNVADMLLSNRFIKEMPVWMEFCLVFCFAVFSTGLTWRLRTLFASSAMALFCAAYIVIAVWLYVEYRYMVPIALPVVAALLLPHLCMVTYRATAEQQEKRRVKSVFEKLVSPNVVNELLDAEKLTLGGARRRLTVYFADVRGFTEMTDLSQVKAEEHVARNNLKGEAAENFFDEQAREVLSTVNLYLSSIADMVKKHNGTLDKYIGDCVMAFWGEPTPSEHHALECVRAAIDSQRAIAVLNEKRIQENQRRELDNQKAVQEGRSPSPLLSVLSLGSGINTGVMTVGLMGSDTHIYNYTVFGREVNLASRLEGVSGRGRIIISESTFNDLQRDDPALAATCVEQPPVMVKGISKPVKIYVVPWQINKDATAGAPSAATVAPGFPAPAAATPSQSNSTKA